MPPPPDDTARIATLLAGRRRIHWGEILFWAGIALLYVLVPSRHLIISEIAIMALFALSLDLILGYAGIVSLGHAAFFGFGAYAAGLFAKHLTGAPLPGLLAAGAGAMLLGFATSFLVLRGADLTRLMVTLGVALVLGEIANQAAWLTGGADGLQGVIMDPLLGTFSFDLFGRTACAYSLAILFLGFLVARWTVTSRFGLSLVAIRENPLRAAALGVPVNRRLVAIYTVSAGLAGIAGALLAQTTQFVSLGVFGFHRSADILLVLIIGGTGWLYGGVIGAVLFKLVQDVLSGLTPQYWHFWLGLLLVILVLVRRERIAGAFATLADRIGKGVRVPDAAAKRSDDAARP